MSFIQHPKVLSNFCSFVRVLEISPIKFSHNSRKARVVKSPEKIFKVRHRISVLLVILFSTQCIFNQYKSPVGSIVTTISLNVLIVNQLLILEHRRKAIELVQLFNCIFQFEQLYPGRKQPETLRSKLNKLIVYSMAMSAIGLPLGFVYGLHIMGLCKTSLVGYWLIPECCGGENGLKFHLPILFKFPMKLIVFLVNNWMWSMTMHSATFTAGVPSTMGVCSIHLIVRR